jgi:hypothetical protein
MGGKTEGVLPDLSGLRLDQAAAVPTGVYQAGTWKSGGQKFRLHNSDVELIGILAKYSILQFYEGLYPGAPPVLQGKNYKWSCKVLNVRFNKAALDETDRFTRVNINPHNPTPVLRPLFVDDADQRVARVDAEILEYALGALKQVAWFNEDADARVNDGLRPAPRFSRMGLLALVPEVVQQAVRDRDFYANEVRCSGKVAVAEEKKCQADGGSSGEVELITLLAKYGFFTFYEGLPPDMQGSYNMSQYKWSYTVERVPIPESILTQDERRQKVELISTNGQPRRDFLFSPAFRGRYVSVDEDILTYAHKVLKRVAWFDVVGSRSDLNLVYRRRYSKMFVKSRMPQVVKDAVDKRGEYENEMARKLSEARRLEDQEREEANRRQLEESRLLREREREERERLARQRAERERAEEARARRRTELQEKAWNGEPLTDEERAELRTLFAELRNVSDDEFAIQWSKVVVRWRTAMKQDEYNAKLGRGEEGTNVRAPTELPSVQMAWLNEGLLAIAAAAVERVRTAFKNAGFDADVDCDKWTGVAAAEFQLPWSLDNDPLSDRPAKRITVRIRATTQPSRCRTVSVSKRQRHGDEHHAHGGIVWTLLLPDDRSNPAQVEARKFAREGMSTKFGYAISKTSTETSHPQVSSTNALRSFLDALWHSHWQTAFANSPARMNAFFQKFSKWTPEEPGGAPVQPASLQPAPEPRAAAAGPSTDDGDNGIDGMDDDDDN